jgi:hypothetical protein
MKMFLLRFALPAFCLFAAPLSAQTDATSAPSMVQTLARIKVPVGKGEQFVQLMRDSSMKVAQARANAGEIISWTLLRSVMPAGEEARSNYMISTLMPSPAPTPMGSEAFAAALKQAGSALSVDQFYQQRDQVSHLVAHEMWQVRQRVGNLAKGHYLFLNYMRVLDGAGYDTFESNVWRPIAAAAVKNGDMSGWIYSVKMLPAGSDTVYSAYTADMFPSWEAAFKNPSIAQAFAQAHPGKDMDATLNGINTLRSLGQRELWTVVERVEQSAR